MFTRRIATFVLGMWIGCCLLVDLICVQSRSFADLIIVSPTEGARSLIETLGSENATDLLRHMAGEQAREYLNNWELAQFGVLVVLALLLTLSDQKKTAPLLLSATIFVLVAAQHFLLTPEMSSVGRQADFLSDATAVTLRARLTSLTQTYGICEGAKLVAGGVLASFLFAAQSIVVRKRRRSSAADQTASV